MDQLVVCAGMGGVRVWNATSLLEALRVELPGVVCCCCCVSPFLHTIITGKDSQIPLTDILIKTLPSIFDLLETPSGWSDGRLRGLGAESGRVVWTVDDAHHGGVNTICILKSGNLISGGRDGRVRNELC